MVEFEEEVERAIEAWVSGKGDYLEAEYRAHAGELGYDPEKVGRAWSGGKQTKLAMAAVVPLRRRKLEVVPLVAPAASPGMGVPLRTWQEVIVPAGATDLERLTYVPGIVGDITEWIVRGATRPNRMMALGVGTVVVGTIIGRYVIGPTGSATHLYIVILAPSGYGKGWPFKAGRLLLREVNKLLIGPGEWSSQVGFVEVLKRSPLIACFVDEIGDEISLLNSQGMNKFVSKTLGTLKKCYNAWDVIDTAETRNIKTEEVAWPAVSIVGAATPESFFGAFTTRDVDGGLANRISPLPLRGIGAPTGGRRS